MKQIVKTVGTIMDQLRMLTGWKFIGAMKGDTCTLVANLVSEQEKKVEVSMEIDQVDVWIRVTTREDHFDQEKVDQVMEKLDVPVELEIKQGESLMLSHHEPFGVLEHSVKGVTRQCIVPMVDAVGEIIADQ